MWLFTPLGFFSVVQKPGDELLTVRARVRSDLQRLRQVAPELSAVQATPEHDYGYRATISREAWARALARLGEGIGYENFKAEVARGQGPARAGLYGRVWAALLALKGLDQAEQDEQRRRRRCGRRPAGAAARRKKGDGS